MKKSGDPLKYLILVNNDRDRNLPGPGLVRDDSASTADLSGLDDDMARVTLKNKNTSLQSGSFSIELSDPGSVELFKSDGTPLSQTSVDLSNPTGDLAGLASSGQVDVWFQALSTDTDFSFALVYYNASGVEVCRDSFHALLATFSLVNGSGSSIDFVPAFPKQTLLIAGGAFPLPDGVPSSPDKPFLDIANIDPLPSGIYYRVQVDGLPPSSVTGLTVQSDDVPGDYYADTPTSGGGGTISQNLAVVYWASTSDVMQTVDKSTLLANLGVNTVHGKSATVTLSTSYDQFTRPVPSVEITAVQPSFHPVGGRLPVDFDPATAIQLQATGTKLPTPDSVSWSSVVTTPTVTVTTSGTSSPSFSMTVDDLGMFVYDMTFVLGGQSATVRVSVIVGSPYLDQS